ncbi:hypothetical protein O181_035479 [Austropuccinia psidii MF-1]|uniref:Uncharacterized protein n=1 Tax=Austropuccinia psidii MF-1 TaxID=1389203 RepID=A0A9Q3D2T5_9BASI|nr:hypothetical protein [Austropuccinia psidii MF-1]
MSSLKELNTLQKNYSYPQEDCTKSSKASEETKIRLNQGLGRQNNCKRDREYLDQDIDKSFNLCQNIKPQTQGHVSGKIPYPQEDIKPNSRLDNKQRAPSKYQYGNSMTYSEKEALIQLPEATSWPRFCGVGDYDHMEFFNYIHGLFIDVSRIPDYWIIAILNTEFKVNASILYTK